MLYFLHGDTAPLQIRYQELLQSVRNKNPGIGEKIFDAMDKEDEERFFLAISTMSMFAPRELLIYKRLENLKNLETFLKGIQKYDITQKEVILLYEEQLTEFGKIQNPLGKKELDLAESLGKIICYRKADQKKAVLLLLQQELGISEGEAEKFVEIVGENYFKIRNEVEKIKSFLDGERYSLQKVLPILSPDKEYSVRKLVDGFLLKKDYRGLLEFLQKDKEYMPFLYALADELVLHLKLLALTEEKIIQRTMNFNVFKSRLENYRSLFQKYPNQPVAEYGLYKKMPNIGIFTKEFLLKKLGEILQAEFLVKSGAMEEEIAVETLIENFYRTPSQSLSSQISVFT